MPQNPSVIAAKTSNSEVYVFDCTKQSVKEQGGLCEPDLRLTGHDKEGYGLSWSSFKEGYLLSGSNDCKICLWDVSAMAQDKVLEAIHVYEVTLTYMITQESEYLNCFKRVCFKGLDNTWVVPFNFNSLAESS